MVTKRFLQILAIPLLGGLSNVAFAFTQCANANSTHCWTAYSGPNYSQVAVGYSGSGAGIACAVRVSNSSDYNGSIDCYSPSGISGGAVTGRGGYQVQFTEKPGVEIPFKGTSAQMRIMSVTIAPESGNSLSIFALRSDGVVFAATTHWPLGPDPRIYFQRLLENPPANLRSIAWAAGIGLTGITSDNMMYYRLTPLQPWTLATSDAVMVAGTADRVGAIFLTGQDANATVLLDLNAGASPQPLPNPLVNPQAQSDANIAWSWFGQLTPISAGSDRVLAVFDAGDPGCPAASSPTPCIFVNRASYAGSSSVPTGWSGWSFYQTDALDHPPISVQEATRFRGRDGELWAITYAEHLVSWTP